MKSIMLTASLGLILGAAITANAAPVSDTDSGKNAFAFVTVAENGADQAAQSQGQEQVAAADQQAAADQSTSTTEGTTSTGSGTQDQGTGTDQSTGTGTGTDQGTGTAE